MDDNDWGQTPEEIQGGSAWKKWRDTGLGASDAPVVMGTSPWKTPYQLWLEKTGKSSPKITNWAQARGNKLEPIARRKYEAIFATAMRPKTFEHGIFRASMDGWNEDFQAGLEIKCPGKEDHEIAKAGGVPEKYRYQIVHQFVVTKAKWIDYFSYFCPKECPDDAGDCARVKVYPDESLMENYCVEAERFWGLVESETAPAMTNNDYLPVNESRLVSLGERMRGLQEEYRIAKERVDFVKDEIISIVSEYKWKRIQCGKMKVYQVQRRATFDSKKMEAEGGTEIEKYRKPIGKPYYRIEFERS